MIDPSTIREAVSRGAGPVWLLDLDVVGRVYRVASEPVEVDGYVYGAGLEPITIEDTGELGAEVGLDVWIGEDWAALVAQGYPLDTARACLRRWWPGQPLEAAEVVAEGVVSQPEYGHPEEGLSLTVRPAEQEAGQILHPLSLVDEHTWPEVTHEATSNPMGPLQGVEGQQYPLPIGYPGRVDIGVGTVASPAVPLLGVRVGWNNADPPQMLGTSLFLASAVPMGASHLRIYVLSGDRVQQEVRPILQIDDGRGQRVSVVQYGSTLADPGQRPEVWAGHVPGQGGGVMVGGQVVRGAGDVISYLLRRRAPRLRVDWPRMAAALPRLNAYMVDTYINTQMSPWAWLEAELFRLLPVAVQRSEKGVWLRYVDWHATAHDAVARLDAGVGGDVSREGRLVSISRDIWNQLEVRYRPAPGGVWLGRAWAAARPGQLYVDDGDGGMLSAADPRATWHPACAASYARYGLRSRAEPYDLSWTWDSETAHRVARDLAAQYALPLRGVTYSGGWDLEVIRPWDVVTITDPEVALDDAVALVSRRELGESGVTLDLLILQRT